MKFVLRIPGVVFRDTLVDMQKSELFGKGPIGSIFVAGSWNMWGGSARKEGHVLPRQCTRLNYYGEADEYACTIEVPKGIYQMKPVVATTYPDKQGFVFGIWILCPPDIVGFTEAGERRKWQFAVK